MLTVIMNGVDTEEKALAMIREGIEEGAEAFCLQLEVLRPEFRNKETYRRIFDAMEGRPAYVCCYRRGGSIPEQTDDAIGEELLLAQDAGAALLDIRTDMYCPSEKEITLDPAAVEKQKKLIDEIHARGSEVLMSSHVLSYISPDGVLELMKLQKSRGTDVCKVVGAANAREELVAAFLTSARIERELGCRHLFLVGGDYRHDHRLLAPFLGGAIYLCVVDSNPGLQPTLSAAKKIRDLSSEYRNI